MVLGTKLGKWDTRIIFPVCCVITEKKNYPSNQNFIVCFFQDEKSDECVFREIFESSYNSYESKKYAQWYLAISKCGQAKYGPKTARGQRAVRFLTKNI